MKCHFFWYSSEPIVWRHWHAVAMQSFKKFHPEITVVLHCNQNVPLPKEWDFVDIFDVQDVQKCPAPGKQWAGPQNSADYMKGWYALNEPEPSLYSDIDFTFVRRLPDWFLKPDGNKMRAPRLYHGWRVDLSPGLFFVSGPGNRIIQEWLNWYAADYAGGHYHFNAMYTLGFLSYRFPEAIEVPANNTFLYRYIPNTTDWDFEKWYAISGDTATIHWGTWQIKVQPEEGLTAWHAARDFALTGQHNPEYAYAVVKKPNEQRIEFVDGCDNQIVAVDIKKAPLVISQDETSKWFIVHDKGVWVNDKQIRLAKFGGAEIIVPSSCWTGDYFNCIILSQAAARKFVEHKCFEGSKPVFEALAKCKSFTCAATPLLSPGVEDGNQNAKTYIAIRKPSAALKKAIKAAGTVVTEKPSKRLPITKKVANFVWISMDDTDKDYPWYLRFAVQTFRRFNPDAEVVVHSNSNLDASFADKTVAIQPDLSRGLAHVRAEMKLKVALDDGGMVFDNDMIFLKPIPMWFSKPEKFLCSKFDGSKSWPFDLNCFAANAHNPFTEELYQTVKEFGIGSSETDTLVKRFYYEYPNNVGETETKYFYPFLLGKNYATPDCFTVETFAIHLGAYYTNETKEDMLQTSNWAYPSLWKWWMDKYGKGA